MTTEDDGARSACPTGPGETAEATTPTIEHPSEPATINWPAWLEEYYQADQTDRIAGRLADVFGRENDPEIAKLKETERTAQARLRDVVSRIEAAPADSQEALAVKLAVAWNYHGEFPLNQHNELTHELGGDLVLLQTSLDALAAQTGLSLFEIYGHDGRTAFPDPTDDPDHGLLWLEREHRRLVHHAENAPGGLSEEDQDASSGRQGEIAKEVAHTIAVTPAGVAAKMRLLGNEYESLKSAWADEAWKTCLTSLDQMNGGAVEPEAEATAGPADADATDNDDPDAKLLALEIEMKAAHEGLDADPGGNDEHQVWYDRMDAVEKIVLATPAQTAAGVLAKLRMAAHYQNPKPDPKYDEVFDGWTRHIIEEAQRIGATVPANPDTELQDLWSQHQALCGAWPADATDEESDKHGERIRQVELQIAATPANSLAGVAVKLQVAAIDVSSVDDVPCARNVMSARDDAMRLTGFGGAT